MSSGDLYPREGWYSIIDVLDRLNTKQGRWLVYLGHMAFEGSAEIMWQPKQKFGNVNKINEYIILSKCVNMLK